jgi:Putative transposase
VVERGGLEKAESLSRRDQGFESGSLQREVMCEPVFFKTVAQYAREIFRWFKKQRCDAVLAYLSRCTHRIAIANSRLVAFDGERVTFKWKDYRAKLDARCRLMTLDANEFIRRFLIHMLPGGFHPIRHYGLFANGNRADNIALARRLLGVPDPAPSRGESDSTEHPRKDDEGNACPCCGGRMIIIETFEPGCQPGLWPSPAIGFDSS